MSYVSVQHYQSVNQNKILLNNFFFKFHGNFLKKLWVDLKACWAYFNLTNTATNCHLGNLRVVFDWFDFVGHAYFFAVPTMNHCCSS